MILVTGATGFIGQSLVNKLEQQTRPYHAYSQRINNPLALRAELAGPPIISKVIHLAGSEAKGRPLKLQHVDIEGTERLIEECQRANIQHLIVVSRLHAHVHARYPLLQAKGEVERAVQKSGLPYTILRSATLFGERDRFLNHINRQLLWPMVWLPKGGKVAWQPLWVEDFVRCLVATLDRPDLKGEIISLGGEERLSYRDMITLILTATRRQRLLLPIRPIVARRLSLLLYGWRTYPLITRFMMDRFSVPDITNLDTVKRHFRFRPHRLRETIAYLRYPSLF